MPEAFDLVTAVNLIDTTADPAVALGQAAALVRPGGHLLLAQPDAWSASATDPARWVPSNDATWDGLLHQYGLETIDREDGFDWELARTPRNRFRYVAHARLARRRQSTQLTEVARPRRGWVPASALGCRRRTGPRPP